MDAGQRAGLQVENTNLPGVDDCSYTKIFGELYPLTDRQWDLGSDPDVKYFKVLSGLIFMY